MLRVLLFLCLFFSSCNGEISESLDTRTPCEKAVDHIEICVGYRPFLVNCTAQRANKILNKSCEEIIKELP